MFLDRWGVGSREAGGDGGNLRIRAASSGVGGQGDSWELALPHGVGIRGRGDKGSGGESYK
jgi:hypothetical protein